MDGEEERRQGDWYATCRFVSPGRSSTSTSTSRIQHDKHQPDQHYEPHEHHVKKAGVRLFQHSIAKTKYNVNSRFACLTTSWMPVCYARVLSRVLRLSPCHSAETEALEPLGVFPRSVPCKLWLPQASCIHFVMLAFLSLVVCWLILAADFVPDTEAESQVEAAVRELPEVVEVPNGLLSQFPTTSANSGARPRKHLPHTDCQYLDRCA